MNRDRCLLAFEDVRRSRQDEVDGYREGFRAEARIASKEEWDEMSGVRDGLPVVVLCCFDERFHDHVVVEGHRTALKAMHPEEARVFAAAILRAADAAEKHALSRR